MAPTTTTATDDALLSAAQRSPAAFGAIFDRYFDVMYRYAAHRLGPDAAEDVAADAFARAFAAVDRAHTTEGSLRAWLFTITGNLVRDELRRRERASRADGRLRGQSVTPGVRDAFAHAPDPALLKALGTLRPEEQETLLLHAWGDLSYEEIAVATSVAVGTVRSRLSRAREQLRAALASDAATTPVTTEASR